jgi:hypothetical protein
MTNIYIYCLFDSTKTESFKGVYSSIKAVHRDALKLANRGQTQVIMYSDGETTDPTVSNLRNTFKGKCELHVDYRTNRSVITIYKTKLKE